jgi:hypothetical protein
MAKGQMTQKEKQGGFANSFQMFAAKAPSESDSSCLSSERSGRAAAQNIKRLCASSANQPRLFCQPPVSSNRQTNNSAMAYSRPRRHSVEVLFQQPQDLSPIDLAANKHVMRGSLLLSGLPLT